MAAGKDRGVKPEALQEPLLNGSGKEGVPSPRWPTQKARSGAARGRDLLAAGTGGAPFTPSLSLAAESLARRPGLEEKAQPPLPGGDEGGILAVFVAAFDPHLGNSLEWSCSVWDDGGGAEEGGEGGPGAAFSPQGLEFRSLPAGIHNLEDDCLYFRHGALFGIAAFHRLMVPEGAASERNARMCSVGALASTLRPLAGVLPVLKAEAAGHNLSGGGPPAGAAAAAAAPYSKLRALLSRGGPPPAAPGGDDGAAAAAAACPLPPPGIFSDFVDELGSQVMLVWKALLLRRRVLILGRPPVSLLCDLVLSTCALLHGGPPASGSTAAPSWGPANQKHAGGRIPPLVPLFAVGLHDFSTLLNTPFYVACTTEQILKHKRKLYDVLVEWTEDGWSIEVPSAELAGLVKETDGDLARFRELCGAPPMSRGAHLGMLRLPSSTLCSCCPPKQAVGSVPDLDRLDRMAGINMQVGEAVAEARALPQPLAADAGQPPGGDGGGGGGPSLEAIAARADMGRADMAFMRALLELRRQGGLLT